MIPLMLKDKAIMSHFQDKEDISEILNVGCGGARIDYHLLKDGYKVYSTDYEDQAGYAKDFFMQEMKHWENELDYYTDCDIFDLSTYPIEQADLVICSEMLEHLTDYKEAFKNLLELAKDRLIVTFPRERSFNVPGPPPKGHTNYWNESGTKGFKDVREFIEMAKPYKVTIEMAVTKELDSRTGQRVFVVCVDKTTEEEIDKDTYVVRDITSEQLTW